MNKQQLKNSILQWAIQGKLVPQIASEGTAEDLLKEIRKEKERLVLEGKLKKKDLEVKSITESEVPFDAPRGWKWVRLKELALDSADGPFGSDLKREHYTERKEVRIVQLSNIGELGWRDENVKYTTYEHLEFIKRSEVFPGDLIVAKMMPAGRTIMCPSGDKKYVLSSDAVRFNFHTLLYKPFLLYAINSDVVRSQIYSEVQGITRVRTSLKKLREYILPLPPLSEQKRIVAKIEELMPLVEEYGQAQERLEQLNKELPDKLKKSILQEAIMGKLVPQIASEGTAEDLLKEIRKEKERLVKEGKLKKKDLEVKPIEDDEVPFEVPESWRWVRLEEISKFNGGYAFKSEKFTENTLDIRVIRISDFNENGLLNKSPVYHPYDESIENYMAENNDILICMTGGTVGKTCLVKMSDEKMYVNQRVADIHCSDKVDYQYVFSVIRSNYIKEIVDDAKNSTNDNISAGLIKGFLIPLPPLAEQKRIVAKVEELMKKIDNIY